MSSKLPEGFKDRFTEIQEVPDGWDSSSSSAADYDQSIRNKRVTSGFDARSHTGGFGAIG